MSIVKFDWDAGNIEHLAKHQITPQEAEEAFELDSVDYYELQQRETEDRVLCLGRTTAGRLLAVVYTECDDTIRWSRRTRWPSGRSFFTSRTSNHAEKSNHDS